MKRLAVAIMVAVGVAAVPMSSRSQDFGRFLERSAREVLKQQLAPENLQRAFTPLDRGEIYPIRTADGWTLVAHRYRPHGPPRPGALPVILCHGLSYNAQFWDLDPSCSLARYLASQGFDVWAVSLRGCGLSQKWVAQIESAPTVALGDAVRRLSRGKVAPTGYATLDPKFANWSLDHHIAYDVPAFVHLVRRETGAPEVAWIGHSMGGIVALGHLARYGNPGIGRLVTVGSQVTMPDGQVLVQFLREMIETRQRQLTGTLRGEQLMAQARTSVHNMFFNEQHVSRPVYDALATWAKDVPSIGLLQQYLLLGERGELMDTRKQFSYARNLHQVTVPILIAGGASDQLAPPVVQDYLYRHVGSADKTLLLVGRAQGFAVDAGHNDALVGLTSQQQFYPRIAQWLRGEGAGGPPPAPAPPAAPAPVLAPGTEPGPPILGGNPDGLR